MSRSDKIYLKQLEQKGITVDHADDDWEKPVSVAAAGGLNLLPGIGNFYLGSGAAADGTQWVYGVFNLLLWPCSIVWGVPQAVIDANTLNKQDLVYHYRYVRKEQGGAVPFAESQKENRPQWVGLYETEGYIGQTDRKNVMYVGYGESVLYKTAHEDAVSDAYEKAAVALTGYADAAKTGVIKGMHLISEYKEDENGQKKVWVLYGYPKTQMEQDARDYKRTKKSSP